MINKILPWLGTLSALALFTGCEAFKASPAWSAATSLRIEGRGDYTKSEAYAKNASGELAQRGIRNKIVTFRYTVEDGSQGVAAITRSCVIYRDESRPKYPWWMIDNMTRVPIWLPNGSVAEQVHFATRHDSEIVALSDMSGKAPEGGVQSASSALTPDKAKESEFYRENGTAYDSESSMDRRKMEEIGDGGTTGR